MRAMLPSFRAAGVDVVLIYSVRTPAEAAFGAEFREAAAAGGVKIIYTVTGVHRSDGPRLSSWATSCMPAQPALNICQLAWYADPDACACSA